MTARIMLLGAKGQIGRAFAAAQRPEDWELGLFGHAECDIAQPMAVRAAVQNFRPDLVINAAAMTNVDKAEKDEEGAMAANFSGPAALAAQCSVLDVPLIQLSTDYVFDGRDTAPYETDAPMNPINIYGYSKMMGEEAIRHELAWHVILRTSSVFSGRGANILTKTLDLINTRDELRMVDDQLAAPTPASAVADALATIAESLLGGNTAGYGTFHLCGSPPCTRFDLTKEIMEVYAPFTDKRPKITPVKSEIFADLAPRPRYSVLSCGKIERIYGIQQPDWREALLPAVRASFEEKP
jgi:dTDP-4-dehydrorhamnose reductase